MISIIVPIYNVEAYLNRCVDSILRQTIPDIEVILVDDGSKDHCREICDDYALRDSRIKVIHKENGGLSDARNVGLEIAHGEYIAFIDSDDWIAPQFLQRLLDGLRNSNSDICECGVYRTEGAPCSEVISVTDPESFDVVSALNQLIQNGVFHQHVWNKLYRREVIGDIRFPLGKTNEDEFWTYQVFGRANRVCKISDVLYNYFQRPGSIMNAGYSLRRLHGLEAKEERQTFIEEKFPQLTAQAKADMLFSCMYAAQMSMQHLSKADFKIAKAQINQYRGKISVDQQLLGTLPKGSVFWAVASRYSFWGTCWLRNKLKRGL